jgi:hypothetical protein
MSKTEIEIDETYSCHRRQEVGEQLSPSQAYFHLLAVNIPIHTELHMFYQMPTRQLFPPVPPDLKKVETIVEFCLGIKLDDQVFH